jgi:hypothetical protein
MLDALSQKEMYDMFVMNGFNLAEEDLKEFFAIVDLDHDSNHIYIITNDRRPELGRV